MNQFAKSILMNCQTSSLDRKEKGKRRQDANINERTSPARLQNLKGKNLRTDKVKGLRRNVHRTKSTNHERPMPLSKSVIPAIVIARKVSKARQRKAIVVTGKGSRTEKLGEPTSNQRNTKNFYLIQVILAGSRL